MKTPQLVNITEERKENEDFFTEQPTHEILLTLEESDFIKVGCMGEWFWAQIVGISKTEHLFICKVDNILVYTHSHGLVYGDLFIAPFDSVRAIA